MTHRDDFEVAMPVGSVAALTVEGRGVPAGPRARVADTVGDDKIRVWVGVVKADFVGGWPWRTTPPALREVAADVRVEPGDVPDGNTALRWAWTGWNYAVAIPATAALYTLAWLLQHPARAIPTGGLAALIIMFSLYG